MEIGKDTELYNKGYMDGYDDAEKAHIDSIKPKLKGSDPDYWTRLEHQYVGMAMQGLMTILPNIGGLEGRSPQQEIVDIATATAHALVEKLRYKDNPMDLKSLRQELEALKKEKTVLEGKVKLLNL